MTEPIKPVEPIKPLVAPKLTEKQQVLAKIQGILREHDNKESEIGLNHEYWNLLNTYRSML